MYNNYRKMSTSNISLLYDNNNSFPNDDEKITLFNKYNKEEGDNIIYSFIYERSIPIAYIPFLHSKDNNSYDYFEKNINYISNSENIKREAINNSIKHLDNSRKCYNSFKINNLIYICIISWILILGLILNIVYYYYKNIYIYILIILTIIILLFAVVYKMITTIKE